MITKEVDEVTENRGKALAQNLELIWKKRGEGLNVCLDSGYYGSANEVIGMDDLLEFVQLSPSESYQYVHNRTGETETGEFTRATLDLPSFPEKVKKPEVLILNGPEHKAITLGRLRWEKDTGFVFQLSRDHTILSQTDIEEQARQGLAIPKIQDLFAELADHPEQGYIVDISREGPLMPLKRLLEEELGVSISSTSATINHLFDAELAEMGFKDPNAITGVSGRTPVIRSFNSEGMNAEKLTTLITIDPLASGMQHVVLVEEVLRRVREQNDGYHQVNKLVILAPMASLFGMSVVANRMAKEGIAVEFMISGTMLDSGPAKYYSPVYLDERGGIDSKMAELIRLASGNLITDRAALYCSRCNWAASFFSPSEALLSSEEELHDLKSSNAELQRTSGAVTLEDIKSMGIRLKDLVPVSTYIEAKQAGQLDKLMEIIEADEMSRLSN